jgi:hypothetical protein
MEDVCIFIDESGAHGFDFEKDGVTKYYVITVIIIEKKYKDEFLRSLEDIYKELTTSPKPKATIFIKDKVKRNLLFDKINKLNFIYFNLIVDKRKINLNSGLAWKTTFFKYFQAMCYNRFISSYNNIDIYTDEYGSLTYQESFSKYIKSKFKITLYNNLEINQISSSSECIEKYGCFLADNISGIVRYSFEQNVEQDTIFGSLSKHFLGDVVFPFNRKNIDTIVVKTSEDSIIRKISLEQAFKYLESKESLFSESKLEVIVLQYLTLESLANNKDYIYGGVIEEYIKVNYKIELRNSELKQVIIKNLRDQDLLISSSSKGYKLTTSKQDIKDFLDLTNKNTVSSIRRLKNFFNEFKKHNIDLSFMQNSVYDEINNFLNSVN